MSDISTIIDGPDLEKARMLLIAARDARNQADIYAKQAQEASAAETKYRRRADTYSTQAKAIMDSISTVD